MIALLRLLALLLGTVLTLAPAALLLFSHGGGELPSGSKLFDLLAPLLVIGLAFGLGPLLLGFPRLVGSGTNPAIRLAVAILLLISAGGMLLIALGGRANLILAIPGLLLEGVLFAVFIWPARRFAETAAIAPEVTPNN